MNCKPFKKNISHRGTENTDRRNDFISGNGDRYG